MADDQKYIPIPLEIALAEDINKSDLVYYTRLRALAWTNDFAVTPPIPIDQLMACLGVRRRRFYEILDGLRSLGWLASTTLAPGYIVIRFDVCDFKVQKKRTSKPLSKLVSLIEGSEVNSSLTNLKVRKKRTSEARECGKSALSKHSECAKSALDPPASQPEHRCELERLALQWLDDRGVHPGIANHLVETYDSANLLEACEVYDWAYDNNRAYTPGWLVDYIRLDWQSPPEYIPPGYFCDACGEPIDKHAPGCYRKFRSDKVDLSTLCTTCGQPTSEHSLDCWRSLVITHSQPEVTHDY